MTATHLGATITRHVAAAADARWFTTGTLVSLHPLVAAVDGTELAIGWHLGTSPGHVGDIVMIGVLRGSPSITLGVLGRINPPPRIFTAEDTPVEAVAILVGDRLHEAASTITVTGVPGRAWDGRVYVGVNITHPVDVRHVVVQLIAPSEPGSAGADFHTVHPASGGPSEGTTLVAEYKVTGFNVYAGTDAPLSGQWQLSCVENTDTGADPEYGFTINSWYLRFA